MNEHPEPGIPPPRQPRRVFRRGFRPSRRGKRTNGQQDYSYQYRPSRARIKPLLQNDAARLNDSWLMLFKLTEHGQSNLAKLFGEEY